MYAATDGGNEAVKARHCAARRRISVDDTSGVFASTGRCVGVAAVERRGTIIRGASAGSRARRRIERRAGTGDDREVRRVEHVGVAVPGGNFRERIGAGDEKHLQRGQTFGVQRRRVSKVYDGTVASQFEIGNLPRDERDPAASAPQRIISSR